MPLKVETAKNTNILDSEFKVHGCVRKENFRDTHCSFLPLFTK